MSGSRNQGSRNLIEEFKETLRLHFKQVQSDTVNLDIGVTDIALGLAIDSSVYGGVLAKQSITTQAVTTEFYPWTHPFNLDLNAAVQGASSLIDSPACQSLSLFWEETTTVCPTELLPERVAFHSCPLEPYRLSGISKIDSSEILLPRIGKPHKVSLDKFKKPLTYRFPKLKANVVRLAVTKNPLPIVRKPIPPHRFSNANRNLFRELLAQKAKVPVLDMQVIGVYDRIFLGLYQSLSQADDGSLQCIPKSAKETEGRNKSLAPVYLIIGRSLKVPGRSFQVVLPMTDVYHDD